MNEDVCLGVLQEKLLLVIHLYYDLNGCQLSVLFLQVSGLRHSVFTSEEKALENRFSDTMLKRLMKALIMVPIEL